MRYIEANPLPQACQDCAEVKACLARGEGEWCCDECDHLGERFIPAPDAPFCWDYVEKNDGAHNETGQIE